MKSTVRRDELAVALLSSAFVGFAVVLVTRQLASWKCLPSIASDTYRIGAVSLSNVHFTWAGCPVLAPLWPLYVGGLALLAVAAWTCR